MKIDDYLVGRVAWGSQLLHRSHFTDSWLLPLFQPHLSAGYRDMNFQVSFETCVAGHYWILEPLLKVINKELSNSCL